MRFLAIALLLAGPAAAETILVQSSTSTANSGFYEHILPPFHAETGITVNVVAVGTGQAIRNAANCDGDVLLVHDQAAEEAFVSEGLGVARHDLMYNDFVILGPEADPADVGGLDQAASALAQIADMQALFASRGDASGTHVKERALWDAAGVNPGQASGRWYRETGSGMGATLNTAIGMGAYLLSDRATWLSFANKQDYAVMVEGDPELFNQYGVILVSPEACTNVNAGAGEVFIDWLLSEVGQAVIAEHRISGQQLFIPNSEAE